MDDKHNKTALMILEKYKPRKTEEKKDSEEGDEDTDDLDVFSDDLIKAVFAKDTKGVKEALKAAFQCMRDDNYDDESDDSEDE